MWKIEKIVSKFPYLYAVVPDHPRATNSRYVLLHRVLMENYLGRILTDDEVVHHKNEDKSDNSIENLQVMSRGEHSRLHSSAGRKWATLKCPECLVIFSKPSNKTHLSKGGSYSCCSRKCRGKFARKIQIHGLTHASQSLIDSNVISVTKIYNYKK